MRAGGVEIGAHTVSHAFVDELDEDEATREIEECTSALARELGARPRHFAYPRGRVGAAARRALVRLGFEAAFTTAAHANDRQTDPMALGRLDAGWSAGLGPFSRAVLDVELGFWIRGFRAG
jgi:peptidoglycan/xylan/chitin deacetylase (PgdA/CDA1 family)